MALSPEEFQKLQAQLAARGTVTQAPRGAGGTSSLSGSDVANRVSGVISSAGDTVNDALEGEGEFAGRSSVRRGFEAAAAAAGAVPAVATELLPKPVRTGIEKTGEVIGAGVKWLADKIGSTDVAQKLVTENPELARVIEEAAGTAAAAGQISGVALGAQGTATTAQSAVNLTKTGASAAAKAAARGADQIKPATQALVDRSKELVKPSVTPAEAVGEVLQGKSDDVARGAQALGSIDTTGVTTYAELAKRLDDNIGQLSRKVDDALAQDPTPIPLSELVTKSTTESGRTISRNYVETSLTHLRELYEKTADDAALASLDDLIEKANTTGLTRLEVNDISRLYNVEFGSKAFNKIGDPLTSVNAQMYENIRSGLKDVARQGMGGTEAAAADKIISSMYNTKMLVQKNVEAVNKLTQKIAERGLVEKLGYTLSKYADLLTGGSIRGLIGGVLPRGAGYKVMNALDLEERLAENLEIIRKAAESGSDDAITNAIKKLDASLLQDGK